VGREMEIVREMDEDSEKQAACRRGADGRTFVRGRGERPGTFSGRRGVTAWHWGAEKVADPPRMVAAGGPPGHFRKSN
jgi:hypothetical protein